MTAEFLVVHLEIRHRATELTPPTIATRDLLAQIFVRRGVQPRGIGFWAKTTWATSSIPVIHE
ncbi:MAG TPA: hypothetical protein VK302_03375 [Terriglobales bacterium]|nr:hypothetical protein [Terriglobales bacterium]